MTRSRSAQAGQGRQGRRILTRGLCAPLSLALATTFLASLAVTSPAEAQRAQLYGVAKQGPYGSLAPSDYVRMRNGNVGTLRFPVHWFIVEPLPRDYRWGAIDSIIGNAAAQGIRSLPYVTGDPPAHVNTPPTRPADRRAFRRLTAMLTRRYGRGGAFWRGPYQAAFGANAKPRPVRTWQIYNEQNGRAHWGARPRPRAYARLLRAGARGVRSVARNKRAEIVLGGMFGTPSGRGSMTSWRFLKRLYRVGGVKRNFDTVAAHPYAPGLRGLRFQMRRIRQVMRRNNDRAAAIRVTEIGWGSARGSHRFLKGPRGQARLLRRSFRLLVRQRHQRHWKIRGINWFSWQDGGAGCRFCASSGLFSGPSDDRKPKPAWRVFKRIAR